jgi:hypothetical protein
MEAGRVEAFRSPRATAHLDRRLARVRFHAAWSCNPWARHTAGPAHARGRPTRRSLPVRSPRGASERQPPSAGVVVPESAAPAVPEHAWGAPPSLAGTVPGGASAASAEAELQPRPAIDRSMPHAPAAVQQPARAKPIADCEGQDVSGVPGAVERHGAPASPPPPNIPPPKVPPQLLSGKQHADKGTAEPAGGLHVVDPHWTGCGVVVIGVVVGGFNCPMGPSPTRSALASDGGLVAGGELLEPLLLLQAAATEAAARRPIVTRLVRLYTLIWILRQSPTAASGTTRQRVVTLLACDWVHILRSVTRRDDGTFARTWRASRIAITSRRANLEMRALAREIST